MPSSLEHCRAWAGSTEGQRYSDDWCHASSHEISLCTIPSSPASACLYFRSVYTLSLSWCHWPVPLASHPPTQLTKSWIGGCLYICRCNAKPFIYDSTSSILLLTYHIYSALPSPIQRTHLSRTQWTLQIQSPSDTQPSRYDMYWAASFILFVYSARWFPHRLSLCFVCCDIIATTHTDFSSYIVPSFPEVF